MFLLLQLFSSSWLFSVWPPPVLKRTLTTTALVFVMFFTVSGGAYTMEGLVRKAGPGLALLALIVIPIVWSLPETLIIGELASMLPEEGGYYRWVRRAFGPWARRWNSLSAPA